MSATIHAKHSMILNLNFEWSSDDFRYCRAWENMAVSEKVYRESISVLVAECEAHFFKAFVSREKNARRFLITKEAHF